MIQRARRLGFAMETPRERLVALQVPVQNLDRHLLAKRDLLGQEHLAHRAMAKESFDPEIPGDHAPFHPTLKGWHRPTLISLTHRHEVDNRLKRARHELTEYAGELATQRAEQILREKVTDSDRERLFDESVREVAEARS